MDLESSLRTAWWFNSFVCLLLGSLLLKLMVLCRLKTKTDCFEARLARIPCFAGAAAAAADGDKDSARLMRPHSCSLKAQPYRTRDWCEICKRESMYLVLGNRIVLSLGSKPNILSTEEISSLFSRPNSLIQICVPLSGQRSQIFLSLLFPTSNSNFPFQFDFLVPSEILLISGAKNILRDKRF